MPRRPAEPSPAAVKALIAAEQICIDIDDCGDLIAERDKLWDEAQAGGVTYEQIGEACGVSAHTARLRVSRRRGAAWAQA